MMVRRCLFCCCTVSHRIHPLENIMNITEDGTEFIVIQECPTAATGGMSRAVAAKMDSSTLDTSNRDQSEITPMHAAAVNGDKSSLAKLIVASARDIDTGDKFGRTPLMFCVLGDRLECAELLIKAGADVNKKDIGGRASLHWAAHKGNFRCLKLMLSKSGSYKEKDLEGQTALHLSTRHKSPKCLALLMKHLEPGEVDDQDKNKRTALHWAASYGNLEHIKMLIKQDSNIGIPDIEGKTPLHWAASSKDTSAVDCAQLILETAPSVINWQDYEGRTALHLAVADGNEAVVNALTSLEKCNVSALDNMFRTPLHWAAVLGHSAIVELLLDRKADSASSDSNGATPLHYAAQNNFAETVEAFLSRKNIRDEPDIEGRTAFMWAAGKGADDVIRTFIKHGVDMHHSDKNGGTALHAAALAGHATTVRLLLENSSQIDATDLLKHTALFRACEMGHTEVVQTLIDCGAKVDVVDQDGRSPLHWAALGGHAYICQTLIKFGIDPNVRDHSGSTLAIEIPTPLGLLCILDNYTLRLQVRRSPLQCAAYGGFVNCMSVLIEHKADPNGQDSEGMTALHWGCSKGHLDAIKLLVEFRAFPNNMEFTEDRYTPLDYALMGEHHEVAQYMIEQGALSITGIQDIAASKIQATFRGFRVRRTFQERKKLLMKHEQLRKDAAKKKQEEGYRQKQDARNKQEIEKRRLMDHSCRIVLQGASVGSSGSSGSKRDDMAEERYILERKAETHMLVQEERERLASFRQKNHAAKTIQKAWKMYNFKHKGISKTAADAIREKRLRAGEEEWQQQIAALTIQLAWRKYYRRKLLRTLTPKTKRMMQMWDPAVISAKQHALVQQIYSEEIFVPNWTPHLHPAVRPSWFKYLPSPAALSFNFAVGQYHKDLSQQNSQPWSHADYLDVTDDLNHIRLSDSFQPHHFSYNLYEY